MEIEMIDTGCIKIKLRTEDLDKLDISFNEMDYSNIETRRVIWTLLDEARKELEVDIDPAGRMLIEAIPSSNGGCILYITELDTKAVRPKKLHMKRISKPQIYEFENVDDLMSAAEALNAVVDDIAQLSELYLLDTNYRLIIYPDIIDSPAIPVVLAQYGVLKGEGNGCAAFTREHGKLLASGNVFATLSNA